MADWNRELSEADLRSIQAGLAPDLAGRSVSTLLEKWSCLVDEIVEGYVLTIYDYTNDLTTRQLLQDIGDSLQGALAERFGAAIGTIDERFLAATEPALSPLYKQSASMFWIQRVPRVRVGELRDDLLTFGHVKQA